MPDSDDLDQEQNFGLAIRAIQITGVAMILGGTAIGLGVGNLFIPEVGLFIAIMGLIEFFAVPAILTRMRDRRRIEGLVGKRPKDRD